MKITFFELKTWEKDVFTEKIKEHKLSFINKPLNTRNVSKIKDAEIICVFVFSKVTKEIINKLPKLKYIATMSTGFDHIDLEECKKRGIKVSNVPTYGSNTVAEHTFALILSLSRKIQNCVEKTRRSDFSLTNTLGFDLKDKTLGVIGTGNIGQHSIRIAKGFEMKVLAFDIKKDTKLAKELGFKYVSFENLLKNSDIVTLHCPYNKHTHHLINKDNIFKMKKGAYLINTARGGLIDTNTLIKALNKKHLAGAGIDVLEEECFIKEEKELLYKEIKSRCDLRTALAGHILCDMENVIVTPHSAFHSKEALLRILNTTIDNIKAFNKKRHINKVQ